MVLEMEPFTYPKQYRLILATHSVPFEGGRGMMTLADQEFLSILLVASRQRFLVFCCFSAYQPGLKRSNLVHWNLTCQGAGQKEGNV